MAGMLPTPHILRRAIVVAGLCLAVAPAAASADSLVFIKSGNVWLSHSDGSGAYRVTSGGNYRSPPRWTTARSPSATATTSCD
jgi:hypothetical protein